MARPKRILQSDYPYHVTTRTNNREFKFDTLSKERKFARLFLTALFQATLKYQVKLFHFVLMSDHYHLIVQTPLENLSSFMQWLNARTAERMNHERGTTGHLWQGRFWDTIIDTDRYLVRAINYLYRNPVRAGMVDDPLTYEFSSMSFYAFGRPAYAELTPDGLFLSLGETDEERRARFIEQFIGLAVNEDEQVMIRAGLHARFYGSEEFIKKFKEKGSSSGGATEAAVEGTVNKE